MGISDARTRETAARLGAEGIPGIGAAITADTMVDPWLFKVSPSNRDYARALKAVQATAGRDAVAVPRRGQ